MSMHHEKNTKYLLCNNCACVRSEMLCGIISRPHPITCPRRYKAVRKNRTSVSRMFSIGLKTKLFRGCSFDWTCPWQFRFLILPAIITLLCLKTLSGMNTVQRWMSISRYQYLKNNIQYRDLFRSPKKIGVQHKKRRTIFDFAHDFCSVSDSRFFAHLRIDFLIQD